MHNMSSLHTELSAAAAAAAAAAVDLGVFDWSIRAASDRLDYRGVIRKTDHVHNTKPHRKAPVHAGRVRNEDLPPLPNKTSETQLTCDHMFSLKNDVSRAKLTKSPMNC